MNTILAFVGMMGSGKGTAVEYFTKQGLPHVYFGGFVYEEVEKRGLDRVADETFVRNDMREQEGPAVMAKRAAVKAEELFAAGSTTVIFDGIYSWAEYQYLKEKFGDALHVIAIVADRAERHRRILERKDGRSYTPELIKQREIDEIEKLNKGGPIAIADHYIDNNVSLEAFEGQLADLQKQIL